MHQAARGGDAIYNSPSQSTRRGEMKVSLCRRHCFLSFVTRGRMICGFEFASELIFLFFSFLVVSSSLTTKTNSVFPRRIIMRINAC